MSFQLERVRKALQDFNYEDVFIEHLGWNNPKSKRSIRLDHAEAQPLAELGGIHVFVVRTADGQMPAAGLRKDISHKIETYAQEHVLIFEQKEQHTTVAMMLYWTKRENNKRLAREHSFLKNQSGDLLLSKIAGMHVDLSELNADGKMGVLAATRKIEQALDIDKVTKKFFSDFKEEHSKFKSYITGIADEADRKWYASIILNRLMFIYFLQKKGFLDGGNQNYLWDKFKDMRKQGQDYYQYFLQVLFFEGFAKHEDKRSPQDKQLIGKVKYLNGGLFLRHRIEQDNLDIAIDPKAFEELLSNEGVKGLFERYSWHLDDTPTGQDNELNPDVLGHIFEKYINQKAFGAYYTPVAITEYLCRQTIHALIVQRVNESCKLLGRAEFADYTSILHGLDAQLCKALVNETDGILPSLKLLDPACGSGAFLVAALKTMMDVYRAIHGRIAVLQDPWLNQWLERIESKHNFGYHIKKQIILDNIYGVDLMEEATEIARLRLFLTLVSSAKTVEQLEPLPNIEFNITSGNSLIGLLDVNENKYNQRQTGLFARSYADVIRDWDGALEIYKHDETAGLDLQGLRDDLNKTKTEVYEKLNMLLAQDFVGYKIKYEQATWDSSKNKEGKPIKRDVTLKDIEALKPFHWGFEFRAVMKNGGFDAIIANPPWDVWQTDEKEFFQKYDSAIQKNKTKIADWKKQKIELMKDEAIREDWLQYVSSYTYSSAYLKKASQYKNNISIVNGKNAGSKINLQSYFMEQSINLLKHGGQCGIVIPSGIYTDLGAKGLREMLFNQTQLKGLFCFENRKAIFEGVDSRFKFVIISLEKGGQTQAFPAAFMKHDVADLELFPDDLGLTLQVDTIKRLSPDSLSVMEFHTELDLYIAEKMLQFPLLGEKIADTWNVKLTNEFNMTLDSHLYYTEPAQGRLPLFTGKMFFHFENTSEHSGYWIDENKGRASLLGKTKDIGQLVDYQQYRWVHRRIASNTNERTFITNITPKMIFTEVNSTTLKLDESGMSHAEMTCFTALCNSFVADYFLRQKVTTTLNMFYIYQLPIPRLTAKDKWFAEIVERAGRLICTSPEYDDLAHSIGLGSHANGVTNPAQRAVLRAELDAMVAHIYQLTESEFAHILGTFPIVKPEVKTAALVAYRTLASQN